MTPPTTKQLADLKYERDTQRFFIIALIEHDETTLQELRMHVAKLRVLETECDRLFDALYKP